MTAYSGHDGSMTINGGVVGEVKSFNVDISTSVFNPSTRGVVWENQFSSKKSATLSVSVNFDPADNAQKILLKNNNVDFVLYPAGDTPGLSQIICKAFVTSVSLASPESGVVSLAIQATANKGVLIENIH